MLSSDPDSAQPAAAGDPAVRAGAAPGEAPGTTGVDPQTTGQPANATEPSSGTAQVPAPAPGSTSSGPGRRRPSELTLVVALGLVAVLAGSALFWSGYALGHRNATQPGTPVTEDEAFQPFWDAYHAIVERYAGVPVDRETLIEGAIKGMVGALDDPYSTYLSPKDYQRALEDLSGSFEGIGAEIGTSTQDGTLTNCSPLGPDCLLTIVKPLDGSPAQAADLQAGDQITAVDGTSLDGLTVDQARDQIRGKKGTSVVLTVVRGGAEPFDVSIVRDVIVSKEVTSRTLADGTIGYIHLNEFSEPGADQMIEALREHLDAGRTRIILDLRGNPGGFVDAARKVASQFIGEGPIFWQQDAQGNQTPTEALPDGLATDPSIKVVLLVDGGSASASEIVAGALQDTGRATLVGQTTYGKGTVQQWTDLGTGGGGLKLTIARWLTPDKRWINKIGVVPDVQVDVPAGLPADADPILDKGVEILTGSGSAAMALRRAA